MKRRSFIGWLGALVGTPLAARALMPVAREPSPTPRPPMRGMSVNEVRRLEETRYVIIGEQQSHHTYTVSPAFYDAPIDRFIPTGEPSFTIWNACAHKQLPAGFVELPFKRGTVVVAHGDKFHCLPSVVKA